MQKDIKNQTDEERAFTLTRVYQAANALEANILKGLLMSAGIECDLQGELLQGALGEIPIDQGAVSISVYTIKERQAREILVNYEQQKAQRDWRCPSCHEINGPTFEFCWSCRTVKNDKSE